MSHQGRPRQPRNAAITATTAIALALPRSVRTHTLYRRRNRLRDDEKPAPTAEQGLGTTPRRARPPGHGTPRMTSTR